MGCLLNPQKAKLFAGGSLQQPRSPVGFKGNLSLLEKYVMFFPGGLNNCKLCQKWFPWLPFKWVPSGKTYPGWVQVDGTNPIHDGFPGSSPCQEVELEDSKLQQLAVAVLAKFGTSFPFIGKCEAPSGRGCPASIC